MPTQIILSNLPANGQPGFEIAAGPGDVYSGGAAGFTPQQNCSLASVTLWLQGFTGANGQQIAVQLCENAAGNQPVACSSFNNPAPNDGSLAQFTVSFPGTANLTAGTTYWIFVYGLINPAFFGTGALSTWVGGGTPSGSAAFNGSLAFIESGFVNSSVVPAFSITAAFADPPSPPAGLRAVAQ